MGHDNKAAVGGNANPPAVQTSIQYALTLDSKNVLKDPWAISLKAFFYER